MKISIDKHSCATIEGSCPFTKTCAQHTSAGDFRNDDGFAPVIDFREGIFDCRTAEAEPIYYKPEKWPYPNIIGLRNGSKTKADIELGKAPVDSYL